MLFAIQDLLKPDEEIRREQGTRPAVETGNKATFGLMGREGYSDWLGKVNETLGETRFTI